MQPVIQPKSIQLAKLASGRRIIHICFFSLAAAHVYGPRETWFAIAFGLVYTGATVTGMRRVAEGLGLFGFKKILLITCSIIPIVNLLAAGWLGSRATNVLRAAGYHVGLFTAYPNRSSSS